jgi:hypothetical protein
LCCSVAAFAKARTELAVAVQQSLDTWQRRVAAPVGFGWVRAECSGQASTLTARAFVDRGFWWSHGAGDPPSPCERCGQWCACAVHPRTRALCSGACRVGQPLPPRPYRPRAAMDRCQQCGAFVRDIRWSLAVLLGGLQAAGLLAARHLRIVISGALIDIGRVGDLRGSLTCSRTQSRPRLSTTLSTTRLPLLADHRAMGSGGQRRDTLGTVASCESGRRLGRCAGVRSIRRRTGGTSDA